MNLSELGYDLDGLGLTARQRRQISARTNALVERIKPRLGDGEYKVASPFYPGDPLTIEANGKFTPSEAMTLGLAIIERAQASGVRFVNPEKAR